MKKTITLLIAGLLSFPGAVFGADSSPQAKNEIVIGSLGYGFWPLLGKDSLNGLKLAVDEYNSHKKSDKPSIKLMISEEAEDLNKAKSALDNMIKHDNAKVVILNTDPNPATTLLTADVKKSPVIFVNDVNNDQTLVHSGPNVFLIASETEAMAGTLANVMLGENRKNVAVIYPEGFDEFPKIFANSIKTIYDASKAQILMLPYKEKDRTDFKDLLKQAIAKKCDGYVFLGSAEAGFAMKQAVDLGVKGPFFGLDSNLIDPVVQKNAQGAAEGGKFAFFTHLDGNLLLANKFIQSYVKAYGKEPELQWAAMQAYDAGNIVIAAIDQVANRPGDFNENLQKALLKTDNFEGVSGNISINGQGASRGIYPGVYQIKNGHAEKISK